MKSKFCSCKLVVSLCIIIAERMVDLMNELTIKELIKLIAMRKGISMGDIADRTNQTRQNLALAFRRGTYNTDWLEKVADALGCKLKISFVDAETGEEY